MTNTLDTPAATVFADLGPVVDQSTTIAEPFVTAPQYIAATRAEILRRMEAMAYAQTADVDKLRLLPHANAIVLVDPAATGLVSRARATARAIELALAIERGNVGLPIDVYRSRQEVIHLELRRAFETWATSLDDDTGTDEVPEAVQALRFSAVFLTASILAMLRTHGGSIAARRRIYGLCAAERELGEAVAADGALPLDEKAAWKAEHAERVASRDRIVRRMTWPAEMTEGGRYAAARRDLLGAVSDLSDRVHGDPIAMYVVAEVAWSAFAAELGKAVVTQRLLEALERRGGLNADEAMRIAARIEAMRASVPLRVCRAGPEAIAEIEADIDAIDDATWGRLWSLATALVDERDGTWTIPWNRRKAARIQLSVCEPSAAYDLMTETYEHIGNAGTTVVVVHRLPDGTYRTRVEGVVQPPIAEKPERRPAAARIEMAVEQARLLMSPEEDPSWIPDSDDLAADAEAEPRPTARSVYASLRESIVNQDDACRTAALALMSPTRGATLLIGSTGSGKTLIAETAARLTGRPFVLVDASQLVPAGITGETVASVADRVLAAADGDPDRASEAVIVFDEINRLVANEVLEYGAIVCGQLLRILDGAPIAIEHKAKANGQTGKGGQMATDRWTIFLAGAWTELRDQINAPNVGFATSAATRSERRIEPTLEELGFGPEFVGRIRRTAFLRPHDVDSLAEILRRPSISPWGALLPRIDQSAHQFAVAEALRRGTGARGLKNVAIAVADFLAFADDLAPDATITADIVRAALRMHR